MKLGHHLTGMDLSTYKPQLVTSQRSEYNLVIRENQGLSQGTGFWWLIFTFDYELEKGIEVRLTNFKQDSTSGDWTLEITKCHYLGITSERNMASFDMVDEFVNSAELSHLNRCAISDEKLVDYLEKNMVPIVAKKIKYKKFKPKFQFFLSHKTKEKPLMCTFANGLQFLGYDTWLDVSSMPMGAGLAGALKSAIEKCDCLIAWLTVDYLKSEYCIAELVYAKKCGKIIIPFGTFSEIEEYFNGDMEFLRHRVIFDPKISFFEVLRRIDETLFNFEHLPL